MANLIICDICQCAVKDKPINLEFKSNNKMFAKKKGEFSDCNDPFAFMEASLFGSAQKWNLQIYKELCEKCGVSLLNMIEEAYKVGKLRKEELERIK